MRILIETDPAMTPDAEVVAQPIRNLEARDAGAPALARDSQVAAVVTEQIVGTPFGEAINGGAPAVWLIDTIEGTNLTGRGSGMTRNERTGERSQ